MFAAVPGIVSEFRHEIVVSVLVSMFLGGVVWPFRKAKEVLKAAQGKLDAVAAELAVQRTNCLATLQSSNQRQVELLEKTVETLQEMHLDQRELLGRIK